MNQYSSPGSSNNDKNHKNHKENDKDLILSVGKLGVKGATQAVGFFQDFLKFINKGNVVDLAVGVVIGNAFTKIVNSLVTDIFSPLIGLATQGVSLIEVFVVLRCNTTIAENENFSTRDEAKKAGCVTLDYGNFIQNIINFIIVGFCVYLIVKLISIVWKKEETKSTDWPCPRCMSLNKLGATRCAFCTADPIIPEGEDEMEYLKKGQ